VTHDLTSAVLFNRVSLVRAGRTVLRDVSFEITPGALVVLVGRSGAGKSTILKLVNRMLDADSGTVTVYGRDTRTWDPVELRRRTGYVLQDIGLLPHLTIAANIGIVPRLLGWDAPRIGHRVDELLSLVGLDPREHATRWPDQLSGGQRQRVGVARALAADPPMLLMDEPFGALDPVTRAGLRDEFKRIHGLLGKTVILVSHDMVEAFALASHVGVVDEGRLVAWGPPARVLRSDHPAVVQLLHASGMDVRPPD
jgi:osmoprotectant transport system ATP-binding protein